MVERWVVRCPELGPDTRHVSARTAKTEARFLRDQGHSPKVRLVWVKG